MQIIIIAICILLYMAIAHYANYIILVILPLAHFVVFGLGLSHRSGV